MISRRFLVGAMAAVPAAAALAPLVPARAAGIGEKPGDMAVGAPDAPVTLIEFFSLTCPHCEWFHKNVYKQLKSDYVDAGRVRFVARDFPLNAPALQAAVLAHCAGPERYFTFIDVLFQTFDDWASSRDFTDKLGQIGELGGVSRDQFADCLGDQSLENSIFQSIADAQAEYDVSGTPTLVVNGEKYDGKITLDALTKHIDRLLAGS